MRLSDVSGPSIVVYKWMSGKKYAVRTREGRKQEGSEIVPLWVAMSEEAAPMFFSLVFNNLREGDEIYLAEISVTPDEQSVTTRKYKTLEYDDMEVHQVGELAYQMGDEESLIMAPGILLKLWRAEPDEDFSSVRLVDQNGNVKEMSI
jgi:hypothetical protein